MADQPTQAARKRDASQRSADGISQVWETRKSLVMKELAAESAANDAKTVRLRALRLEKERQDAQEAGARGESAAAPRKKSVKRIVPG